MKKYGIAPLVAATTLMGGMVATSLVLTPKAAVAQQRANVGQLVSGLINVNIGAVQVDIALDDVTLVNVEDVLNDAQIDILNNVLNNSPIASNNSDILTNLLRDAEILTDNQVVVGVLTGGQLVFQNVP